MFIKEKEKINKYQKYTRKKNELGLIICLYTYTNT